MTMESISEKFAADDAYLSIKTIFHTCQQRLPSFYSEIIKQFNHNSTISRTEYQDEELQSYIMKNFAQENSQFSSKGKVVENQCIILVGYQFRPDLWNNQSGIMQKNKLCQNRKKSTLSHKINVEPQFKQSLFKRQNEKNYIEKEDFHKMSIRIKNYGQKCQLSSNNALQIEKKNRNSIKQLKKIFAGLIPDMNLFSKFHKTNRNSKGLKNCKSSIKLNRNSSLLKMNSQFWTVMLQKQLSPELINEKKYNSQTENAIKPKSLFLSLLSLAKQQKPFSSAQNQIAKVIQENCAEQLQSAQQCTTNKNLSNNSIITEEYESLEPLTKLIKKSEFSDTESISEVSSKQHTEGDISSKQSLIQSQSKAFIIYLPQKAKLSLFMGHHVSKIISVIKNYIHFQPVNCIQNQDQSLGVELEKFLYQNKVSQIQIHVKIPQSNGQLQQSQSHWPRKNLKIEQKITNRKPSRKNSYQTLYQSIDFNIQLRSSSTLSKFQKRQQQDKSLKNMKERNNIVSANGMKQMNELDSIFIEKLSSLTIPTTKKQQFQTISRVYDMKLIEKSLKKQIKNMKLNLQKRVNELMLLSNMQPLNYSDINVDVMRKLKYENLKQKIDKLKQLISVHQNLALRNKDYQSRKKQLKDRIEKQNQIYMSKIDSLRKQIKELDDKNQTKKAELNSKVYSQKLAKKTASVSEVKNSSNWYRSKNENATNHNNKKPHLTICQPTKIVKKVITKNRRSMGDQFDNEIDQNFLLKLKEQKKQNINNEKKLTIFSQLSTNTKGNLASNQSVKALQQKMVILNAKHGISNCLKQINWQQNPLVYDKIKTKGYIQNKINQVLFEAEREIEKKKQAYISAANSLKMLLIDTQADEQNFL